MKITKKIYKSGKSLALTIPSEIVSEMELSDGDNVELDVITTPAGKYVSVEKKA